VAEDGDLPGVLAVDDGGLFVIEQLPENDGRALLALPDAPALGPGLVTRHPEWGRVALAREEEGVDAPVGPTGDVARGTGGAARPRLPPGAGPLLAVRDELRGDLLVHVAASHGQPCPFFAARGALWHSGQ